MVGILFHRQGLNPKLLFYIKTIAVKLSMFFYISQLELFQSGIQKKDLSRADNCNWAFELKSSTTRRKHFGISLSS